MIILAGAIISGGVMIVSISIFNGTEDWWYFPQFNKVSDSIHSRLTGSIMDSISPQAASNGASLSLFSPSSQSSS
jgi:hypothetical protein